MHGKKDWSRLLQPVLLPLAFIVGIGSFMFHTTLKCMPDPLLDPAIL